MKKLLIDHTPFQVANLTISEALGKTSNGRMRVKGKLQEAEAKNGNNRVYPKEVLLREVEKYQKGPIASNTAMGELDHPEVSIVNLGNVSHVIKKVWWENNDLMGELEILNTPSGKIAQELILAGIPLGISSRGMGSVKQIGESVEVQDDYELVAWDFVSIPSTNGSYMRLAEGKKIVNSDYNRINSIITEILCSQLGICPLCP